MLFFRCILFEIDFPSLIIIKPSPKQNYQEKETVTIVKKKLMKMN